MRGARVVEARAGRAARLVEVARHRERAGDAAQDPRVGVLGDLGDRERRGGALDLAVGEVAVAELGERVVADVQHPRGQPALGRDGEVPRQREVAPGDAGAAQRAEDLAIARAQALRAGAALERAEALGRLDALARRGAQPAQRDDVALALVEVLARVDQQHAVARALGVGVELGVDELALARAGVDHHEPRAAGERAPEVRQRHELRARERPLRGEARDAHDDRLAGAEAVLAVVVRDRDAAAGLVGGHRAGAQAHAQAGRALAVAHGQVHVVGERHQARARGERVAGGRGAALGGGGRREHEQGRQAGEESFAHGGQANRERETACARSS